MTDYTPDIRRLLEQFSVDPRRGLTEEVAAERLRSYGENRLQEGTGPGPASRILNGLRAPMTLVLLGAGAVSLAAALLGKTGNFTDPAVILSIAAFNTGLGVCRENRVRRALLALQGLFAPTARVRREGREVEIPTHLVVPGDVVLLQAGDRIPADGRLLPGTSLWCDESSLTGEGPPAEKDPAAPVRSGVPLEERRNMAYTGCTVVHGRGELLVTRTGTATERGRIAIPPEGASGSSTPLQQRLDSLGRHLGLLALGVCLPVLFLGLLQGMPFLSLLLTAVSLAVATVPERLPAVAAALAPGVERMARRGAMVRRPAAVEALAGATVICADTTALTQNRMEVRGLWTPDGGMESLYGEALSASATQTLRLGTLCCNGRVEAADGVLRRTGNPAETAILAAALKLDITREDAERKFPRIAELPFDAVRGRMTTIHRHGDRVICVTKGSPEAVLPLCRAEQPADAARGEAAAGTMARTALRVLAVACRELAAPPGRLSAEELERELTLAGLIGMADPLREESADAVAKCRRAGIRTVMITGDHPAAASAVAGELGIWEAGCEVAEMNDNRPAENLHRHRVFARVNPQDKIRIVTALQQRGEVVAVTGSGIGDAPALAAADIGCAMGITGSDAVKEAADMVLADDSFSTIVEAVRQGRSISENIVRTLVFLLSSGLGAGLAVLFAMLPGWGSPLPAVHLLLIHTAANALLAPALGVEPGYPAQMERPPVPGGRGALTRGLWAFVALQGLMVGLLTLAGYYIGRFSPLSVFFPPSPQRGSTMAFLVLALCQLTLAFNCRSARSLFRLGFWGNPALVKACGAYGAAVLLICLLPPLERLFHAVDLSMLHWFWVLLLALAPLALAEAAKAAFHLWRQISSG